MHQQAQRRTIVIHCGHSVGYDSGAVSSVITEAQLNQNLCGKLLRVLDQKGYNVFITHTTDESLAPYKLISNETANYLRNVGPAVNAMHPDLALCIHHNSGGASSSGTELYWSSYRDYDGDGVYSVPNLWGAGRPGYRDTSPCPEAEQSFRLAQIVRDQFAGFPNLPFRGIYERDDYLPAHAQAPCILYEGGFLSNPGEANYLATDAYQDEAARRLAASVDVFFNNEPQLPRITLSAPRRTVETGSQLPFTASFNPADQPLEIQWESTDPNVASIDGNGVVTGLAPGSTTIRAVCTADPSTVAEVGIAVQPPGTINVSYNAHIQDIGWSGAYLNGESAGTTGQQKQLEAINIQMTDPNGNMIDPNALGIRYRTHVANVGWQDYRNNGENSGTEGQNLRIEAAQITLTGARAPEFNVFYRTHIQNYGWTGWSMNGAPSGSEGMGLRVEAIEISVFPTNYEAPPNTAEGIPFYTAYGAGNVRYSGFVENNDWMPYVADSAEAGVTGQNLKLKGLKIFANPNLPSGSVECSAYVEGHGWLDYSFCTGIPTEDRRIEALKFRLTGELAQQFDVHYQTHVQNIGWTEEKANEEESCTPGQGVGVEAVKVWLTPKQ